MTSALVVAARCFQRVGAAGGGGRWAPPPARSSLTARPRPSFSPGRDLAVSAGYLKGLADPHDRDRGTFHRVGASALV
jgi:hypothetical protein